MSAADEARRNANRVVGGDVNKLMRALGIEGLGRLMQKTPVDTGRARANWNASINAPDTSTNESATSAQVAAKQNEGRQVIAKTDFADGDDLYLTNGLPYIKALEDGHSQQAPKGMVKLTARELKSLAEKIARQGRA